MATGGNLSGSPGARAMGAGATATNQGMNAGASGNTNMSGGFNWGNHQGDRFGGGWGQGQGHGWGGLGGMLGQGGLGQMPWGQGGDAWHNWINNLRNQFHPQGQPGAAAPPATPAAPPPASGAQSPAVPGGSSAPTPSIPMGWGQGGQNDVNGLVQGILSRYPGLFNQ